MNRSYIIATWLAAISLAGCQTMPSSAIPCMATGSGSSEPKPASVRALQNQWGGVAHDEDVDARLERVGRRLQSVIPHLSHPCVYEMVNSRRMNALCLEQFVFVTRGLYERLESDDLLAAVLAHEMAHITADDQLKPSRSERARLNKEIAADRQAIPYMISAGYDPSALSELLVLLEKDQPAGWAQRQPSHSPANYQFLPPAEKSL